MAVLSHWGNIKPLEHISESGSMSMLLTRSYWSYILYDQVIQEHTSENKMLVFAALKCNLRSLHAVPHYHNILVKLSAWHHFPDCDL